MTRLLVRNLDPDIVSALKRRAAQHGRSAEAEHREILKKCPGATKKIVCPSIGVNAQRR